MTEQLRYYLRAGGYFEERQMEQIISCFRPRTVKKNTILLPEGAVCRELYFINSGCVRTYYVTGQGQEKTRYIAFENSIVASIASFLSRQPSFEFVDTLEDCELSVISREDFYRLAEDIPQWERFYRTLLETAYLFQHRKIEQLVTLSAKQRYTQLLTEHPQYLQRLSNKILASYLDMSQETLSRLKSK